ncbi:MAG TPA: MBL fold metallo-hydrolase [Candidatus Eremiobacteraceae bacterium]|nr:MBL fold metallo-hydrolase [Candidatus Eremiobacteraceae bacterium]
MPANLVIETFPVGPLMCNCVIVGDDVTKTAIVVDPGDEIERVTAVLDRRGFKVAAIVATHAHIDHVGGFGDLKRLTGAKVLLHEADAPLYDELAMQAQWLGIDPPSMTKLDGTLDEKAGLSLGAVTFDVRHTPGHSPGSVSLVLPESTPIVLSGDTLFAGSIGRTDLWGGSFEEIITSIKSKLLTLPDETIVIPGHGPRTTIGTERKANPFL